MLSYHIITRFLCIQDVRIHDLRELDKFIDANILSNVCSVAAICRQVHYIEWERPRLFHAAISLINRLDLVWMWDLSYRIIWIKFAKMLFVYVKCGTHRLIHWRIIVFLTQNPNVFMIVDINDALVVMCRNIGICCSFRAVAALEKHAVFILLPCI